MPPRVDNLRESSHRVVRLVALGHLADAAGARDRLSRGSDDEALHDFRVALRRFRSWERAFREYTRDDISKKRRRQLRDLARDTGASRDLEVHLAWLADQRESLTGRERPGLGWLLSTLDAQKAKAGGSRDSARGSKRHSSPTPRESSCGTADAPCPVSRSRARSRRESSTRRPSCGTTSRTSIR
jgi:hypothetical protein